MIVSRSKQRKLRRVIGLALAGATMGTVLMMPSVYADTTYTTEQTGDFSASAGEEITFTGNSAKLIGNATAQGWEGVIEGGHFNLEDGASITGDTTAIDGGSFEVQNSSIGHAADNDNAITASNALAQDGGYYFLNNSFILGNATAQGIYADPDGLFAPGGIYYNEDDPIIPWAEIEMENGSVIIGDASAKDGGQFTLTDSGIGGNAIATNGGHFDLDDSIINGDAEVGGVYADPEGLFGEGGLYEGEFHGAEIELHNGSGINGSAIANSGGLFSLNSGSHIEGNATANGGEFRLTGNSYINGDVTAKDGGSFILDSAHINGSATVNSGGYIEVTDGWIGNGAIVNGGSIKLTTSSVIGTLTVQGDGKAELFGTLATEGTTADPSTIDGDVIIRENGFVSLIHSNIEGQLIITDNGSFYMDPSTIASVEMDGSGTFEMEDSTVLGNASFNGTSTLKTTGTNVVNGVLNLGAGTTFSPTVDVSNPGANTLTVPTVNIAPGSVFQPVILNNAPLTQGETFNVLNAGSVTGTFTKSNLFDVDLDPATGVVTVNSSTLSLDNFFEDADVPGTSNQHSVVDYLNTYQLGTLGELINVFSSQDTAVTLNALNAVSGDSYSAYNSQAYWNQHSFINHISSQLRNDIAADSGQATFALNTGNNVRGQLASLRQMLNAPVSALGYSAGSGATASNVWASISRGTLRTNDDGGTPDWRSSGTDITVGYSGGGDAFRWGVAASHQDRDLDFNNRTANGDVDGWNLGLYGTWKQKSTYVSGILGYGNYDNKMHREVMGDAYQSKFKSHSLSAYVEVGKRLANEQKGGISPYASLSWVRSNHGSFTETGGAFALDVKSESQSTFASQLGARYIHPFLDKNSASKGGFQAGLSWLHRFGGTDTGVTSTLPGSPAGSVLRVNGTSLAGNAAQLELSIYGKLNKDLLAFAGYQGTFSSNQKAHSVSVGLGYQF